MTDSAQRPRILYDLSQHLAVLLEKGIRGGPGEHRIPVLLCHPLDPLEAGALGEGAGLDAATVGILYPAGVTPETRLRQAGWTLEPAARGGLDEHLRGPALWFRVRFVFLLVGGAMEDQLAAYAAALRTLHDHPLIHPQAPASEASPPGGPAGSGGSGGSGASTGTRSEASSDPDEASDSTACAYPLTLVADPDAWRALGLPEHRLTLSFDVTAQLESGRREEVGRVLEREVEVEGRRT